ncbi:sigma-54-dependent Fis family transcriptional regulator [Maridesulfovibrio bastinii]|uniref:sigma-54-dependent Fis family transcriptional regulator n=1 Tax=Maridesulfovibrio bastinii TaxID=47157 RepID=UPI000414DF0D|nr:sigma-54-dependent Fis family transcriptional regulator [Maridesulfovibrio bastinii]
MRIAEIMQHPVHVLSVDKKLQDAAEIFYSNKIHGVHIIGRNGKPVGMFTSEDLIKAAAQGSSLEDSIGKYMREMICTVNAETHLNEICWDNSSYLAVSDGGRIVGGLDVSFLTNLTNELNDIIDISFDGIFITDENGRVILVNKAYERITGIRAAEVLGQTMSELVEKGFYDESVTVQVMESGKIKTIVQKLRTGKTIVVTGNPLFDSSGKISRVVTNVRDVTELRQLQRELEKISELKSHYKQELETLKRSTGDKKIIIRSKKMREVYDQAMRLSRVDSTVLISGESGVGKEIMAGIIHKHGPRRKNPFIKISCAAIPEHLLESELFGYMPGAFTGALSSGKPGMFELANHGTLFLDEIGEMPLGLQSKLLRVLQEQSIVRVGGVSSLNVDVRIIAATNRDLELMVARKEFRNDLFYRLNVVPLVIPPLREREEAIIDFIYHFLGKYNSKYGMNRQLEPGALDFLASRDWPGNVRELENAIERVVVMAHSEIISQNEVTRILYKSNKEDNKSDDIDRSKKDGDSLYLKRIVEQSERRAIINALSIYKSTRKSAKALGVNQSTIVRKAKKLGINLSDAQ